MDDYSKGYSDYYFGVKFKSSESENWKLGWKRGLSLDPKNVWRDWE